MLEKFDITNSLQRSLGFFAEETLRVSSLVNSKEAQASLEPSTTSTNSSIDSADAGSDTLASSASTASSP